MVPSKCGGFWQEPTLHASLRPIALAFIIAVVGFALTCAEAGPVPDASVVPAPPPEAVVATVVDPVVDPALPAADPPPITLQPVRKPTTQGTTGDLYDPLEPRLRAASFPPTESPTDEAPPAADTSSTTPLVAPSSKPLQAPPPTSTPNPPSAVAVTPPPTSTPSPPSAVAATPPPTGASGGLSTSGETPAPADPPKVQTAPRPGSLQPSVFDDAQIVSFYGYPGIGVMGELGLHSASGAAAAIARVAAEYDALNGPREVMPALHLIVAVAQRDPGRNGLYLSRMGDDRLEEYIEAARETGILLFLDLQIGWSDALTETRLLEDALREPFVHLALDPEFATRGRGTAPGVAIGSLGADDVNAVQEYLAELVRTDGLPPKVLVLHQFLQSMLTDVDQYDDVPEVDVTIDMDGWGSPPVKLTKYRRYAVSDYAEYAAIKLFYRWDAPLMTPARLLALDDPPDLVIYQ